MIYSIKSIWLNSLTPELLNSLNLRKFSNFIKSDLKNTKSAKRNNIGMEIMTTFADDKITLHTNLNYET
ncbi:hypothetical protein HMPREF0673_01570 [Leyella stercorea DSM 18206]|uniref:Uncharacterized protein n=1 Tax=Leyella stercorea DSM 18206 TaxID=1002367 RepID=G6AY61_9BACT|nr:hypothetical protein HMPREF0673_01570 [Leyella stercorea DSM 18206]